jgi:phage shock protein PspC (stress-responsive transcriptional regulator)
MTNIETEPSPLPPPSPAPIEPTERRWARSDERVVFGVAGGLARALAIEPLLVRIAFVVMALFSGVGVVLYLAGLAMLADSPTSPPPSMIRRIVGAIAVLAAARWLFAGDAHLPAGGWVVAIGLLGIAVALWHGRGPASTGFPPPVVDTAPAGDGGSTADRWSSWTAQRQQRPRPPRSALGLLTIGAAAIVGAAVWLSNHGVSNRSTLAFGWATLVLGAGMVIGTVAGRARWLIIPAAATAAVAVIASALSFAGVGLNHATGGHSAYIVPGGTVASTYRTGIGDFELWLVDDTKDVSTSVEVGVGNLRVVVPDNARVQIDSRVGIGTIDALGSSVSGYRRTLSLDTKQGSQLIKLTLRAGTGSIEVRRASSAGFPYFPVPVPTVVITAPPDIPVLQQFGDGTVLFADGSINFNDGGRIEADGTYQIPIVEQRTDGSVQLENGATIRADGTVVSPGGFVIHRDVRPPSPSPVPTTAAVPVTPTAPNIASTTTTTMSGVQP